MWKKIEYYYYLTFSLVYIAMSIVCLFKPEIFKDNTLLSVFFISLALLYINQAEQILKGRLQKK